MCLASQAYFKQESTAAKVELSAGLVWMATTVLQQCFSVPFVNAG
jgi:hypothetical protein